MLNFNEPAESIFLIMLLFDSTTNMLPAESIEMPKGFQNLANVPTPST